MSKTLHYDTVTKQGQEILQTLLQDLGFKNIQLSFSTSSLCVERCSLYFGVYADVDLSDEIQKSLIFLFSYKMQSLFGKKIIIDEVRYDIILDINGYKKEEERKLLQEIQREASECLLYNKDCCLPPMELATRFWVHHYLVQKFPAIDGQSVGKEPFRYIRLRNKNRPKK